MFDPIKDYLLKKNGVLTPMQAIDLTLHQPDSPEAAKLLTGFVGVASNTGDSFAIATCAACYRTGWGVSRNSEIAFKYAEKFENSDFAPGLTELGFCQEEGIGTSKNLFSALKNLTRAANLEYAEASIHLASSYQLGTPYGKSEEKAISFAVMAIQTGYPFSAYLLATWYEGGGSIKKNEAAALEWYLKASDLGSISANARLGQIYSNGELGVSQNALIASNFYKLSESGVNP
jgi:TPR repeat protein